MFCAFAGASACIQLKKFDEANTWCEKGLAVSFTGIDIFIVNPPEHSFNVENVSFVGPALGLSSHIIQLLAIQNCK